MNAWEGDSRSAQGYVQRRRAAAASSRAAHGQCLIMSTALQRRELLSGAAAEAGWDTVLCADSQNALAAVRRLRFQMAWIDLDHHGVTANDSRGLCQLLADIPDLRLAICGHEADVDEEIWARQLGVWLYVPGLATAPSDELTLLCAQAYCAYSAGSAARLGGTLLPRT